MGLDYAELYGIDLDKLRHERFDSLQHYRMLRWHYKRVEEWYEWIARHTEKNVLASIDSTMITSTEKNGN
jgi:hypothetical protein